MEAGESGDEKRGVVILRSDDYDEWLHTRDIEAARRMLNPFPADDMTAEPEPLSDIRGARVVGLFGDMFTTDHISPIGVISAGTPAQKYLSSLGIAPRDFVNYAARRLNHDVMIRGTFANVRIKNLMLPALPDGSREEGGLTVMQQGEQAGTKLPIYDAAMAYQAQSTPTVIFAGEEYGTGSSRDWAAKGTQLLGIKAVVARSFERIHRSNLVGMGVLPLQFKGNDSWQSLGLTGSETIAIDLGAAIQPQGDATLRITRANGQVDAVKVTLRIDTPIEVSYYQHGGILPYVLRQLLA